MQFFKIQAELNNDSDMINDGETKKVSKREGAHKILTKTEEFNGLNNHKYCFLSDINGSDLTLGVILSSIISVTDYVNEFLCFVGLNAKILRFDEITFGSMQHLLRNASRSYIEDKGDILERFEIDDLSGSNVMFGENILSPASKDEIFASAKKLYMSDSLIPELERIYAGCKYSRVSGHPVHYIFKTDDRDTRRENYKILLNALYANSRIKSSRYTFINISQGSTHSECFLEAIYKLSNDSAVVIRYINEADDDEDSNFLAPTNENIIEDVCKIANKYRNKVLTIFCLPRESKALKDTFLENLNDMSFIELNEDMLTYDSARAFLKNLAKENLIRSDKWLFEKLEADKLYNTTELPNIFNEWYDKKLKSSIYPQYKDISVAKKEIVKSSPKGSAYSELMEMIGLSDAKQVIKKALNYYKMQKLYAEKGVKIDTPAMHMIFMGNPGTAKTTAARLFARIMKENGLLSSGHLVEVGRGDLVGKYVGWTAKIVQAKFKQAMGGVLFIDEAYSLSDKSGSFGTEAINTIVQEMENHRHDVVVIFAGYPDQMEEFLQTNPGLRSRIAFHVSFADYNSEELCEIAKHISQKNGMVIEDKALEKLYDAFDVARCNTDFGNGRYVRNIFEQAKMNQASRLIEKDLDEISTNDVITITAEDIIIPEVKKITKRQIGF